MVVVVVQGVEMGMRRPGSSSKCNAVQTVQWALGSTAEELKFDVAKGGMLANCGECGPCAATASPFTPSQTSSLADSRFLLDGQSCY